MKNNCFSFTLMSIFLFFSAAIHCNSTPVDLVQIPLTGGSISEPGNYYVGYNITGIIAIDADRVTLNLNGHTVQGLSITNHQDVIITNGTVDGSTLTTGQAILISESENIQLSNLNVCYDGPASSTVEGIHIEGAHLVFLSDMLVENFPVGGCSIQDGSSASSRIFMTNCALKQNKNNGLLVNSLAGAPDDIIPAAILKGCTASLNEADGFAVKGRSEQPSVYFFDCISRANGTNPARLGNGFHGFQATSISTTPGNFVAIRCIAETNFFNGFYTESDTRFYFDHCFSGYNGNNGFDARGDANSTAQVKSCIAMNNRECGFNNNGSNRYQDQPVAYVANYASDNGDAYCLSGKNRTGSPYDVLAFDHKYAQFWRNITGP
jgi:hypothetical protein